MSAAALLRVGKLKGPRHVRDAVAHNRRAIQAERGAESHIDAARSHLNECLAGSGSPEDVQTRAKLMMEAAGVRKLRKDAVRALEFIVSLAPGQCASPRELFVDALRWLAKRFGGDANILAADIHHDESAPHMHVLVLPLLNGRMVGSDAIGGRSQLRAMQNEFFDEVAKPYGLRQHQARMVGATKAAVTAAVLAELKRRCDPGMNSVLWPQLRAVIEANPGLYAGALGLDTIALEKPKKLRSMTDIFISKGKGSQRREDENPIGFGGRPLPEPDGVLKPQDEQTLALCRVRVPPPHASGPKERTVNHVFVSAA